MKKSKFIIQFIGFIILSFILSFGFNCFHDIIMNRDIQYIPNVVISLCSVGVISLILSINHSE